MSKVTMHIGIRWWLKPWICLVLILNCATGWRPSEEAIARIARRALYVRTSK